MHRLPLAGRLYLLAVTLFVLAAVGLQVARLTQPGDGCTASPSPVGLWVSACPDAPAALEAVLPGEVTTVAGRPVERWLQAAFGQGGSGLPAERAGETIALSTAGTPGVPGALVLEVALPLRMMSGGWLFLRNLADLLVGVAFLALGVFVYLRRWRDPAARVFLLLGGAYLVAVLLTRVWWYQLADLTRPGYLWLYTVVQLPANWLLYTAALHFTLVFPSRSLLTAGSPRRRALVYAVMYLALPAAALAGTASGYRLELMPPGLVAAGDGSVQGALTLVWNWTARLSGAIILVGAAALVLRYRATADAGARRQMRWVIWGIALGVAPFVLWRVVGERVDPLFERVVYLFPLLIPASLTASILRYRLWDIDVLINRTLVYSLVTLLLGLAYIGVYSLLSGLFVLVAGQALGGPQANIALTASTLAIALAFLPVRERAQRTIDRVFYPGKVVYQEAIARLSRPLAHMVSLNELTTLLVTEAALPLELERVWLLLPDEHGAFAVARSTGSDQAVDAALRFLPDSALVAELQQRGEPLNVAERVAETVGRRAAARSLHVRALEEFGVALAVPLFAERRLRGLYLLGPRRSGDAFSRDDVALLFAFAQQAAIAIRNAQLQRELLENERRRERLAQYLSPRVAEQVLNIGGEQALGGERLVVSVLFSDIRGFTSSAEHLSVDVLTEMLNAHLDALTRVIFAYDGTLDKYTGDGLMAVFGAPLAQADHAERAVQAALDMLARQAELQRGWQAAGLPVWEIGIGINSGEVVAGNFGSARRFDYTVVGDAVNIAARLKDRALAGQILANAATVNAVAGLFVARPLEPMLLRGRTQPVQVYEVLARAGERDRQPAG